MGSEAPIGGIIRSTRRGLAHRVPRRASVADADVSSAQSSDKVDQEIAAQLVREANENGSDYVSLICGSDTSTAIAVLDDDRHLASRPTYVAALSQLCNR